jgi:hypothetical protein
VVDTRLRFRIKNKDLEALRDEILAGIDRVARNNLFDLRPFVQDSIDKEITKNKNRFIPNAREAAELGVGKNGDIFFEKTETAWEALKVESGERVTSFSVTKARRTLKSAILRRTIGDIRVDISEEAFYRRPRSRVKIGDSEILGADIDTGFSSDEIPWMKWFVEGKTISGSRFSNRRPIPETSRTGRGIMIVGGQWVFRPRSVMVIDQLLDRIRIRIGRDLRAKGAVIART